MMLESGRRTAFGPREEVLRARVANQARIAPAQKIAVGDGA